MAFQYQLLSNVLEWKFKGNPNFSKGISTRNGQLTEFHPSIGPFPTDTDLALWVAEYEALPAAHEAKDPKAARLNRFDALGQGLQDLKDFIRAELL